MGINDRLEVIEMSNLPNLIYRFDIILIKFKRCVCVLLSVQPVLNIYGKVQMERAKLSQDILKEKEMGGKYLLH